MQSSSRTPSDDDLIREVLESYIAGAKSGRGDDMKPAFHDEATVFGYIGEDLFAGPIQKLFEWNDQSGAATSLQARIAGMETVGSVATVRLELEDWTGYQFTDLFTLLKVEGRWQIMNKVFHLHTTAPAEVGKG